MGDFTGVFKGLAVSRKFWLAVIGLIGAVFAYAQGAIDAEMLVTAIVGLMMVVIGSIALEDAALKFGQPGQAGHLEISEIKLPEIELTIEDEEVEENA